MPTKVVEVIEAQRALGILGILKNRVFTQNPEGAQYYVGNTWTAGDYGAVGVYNFDKTTQITIVNEDLETHKDRKDVGCFTTIIYPETIKTQVERALNEAKSRVSRERGS